MKKRMYIVLLLFYVFHIDTSELTDKMFAGSILLVVVSPILTKIMYHENQNIKSLMDCREYFLEKWNDLGQDELGHKKLLEYMCKTFIKLGYKSVGRKAIKLEKMEDIEKAVEDHPNMLYEGFKALNVQPYSYILPICTTSMGIFLLSFDLVKNKLYQK